jgi:hypothetical protein
MKTDSTRPLRPADKCRYVLDLSRKGLWCVYGNSVYKFIQDTIILFVKVNKVRGKSKSMESGELRIEKGELRKKNKPAYRTGREQGIKTIYWFR